MQKAEVILQNLSMAGFWSILWYNEFLLVLISLYITFIFSKKVWIACKWISSPQWRPWDSLGCCQKILVFYRYMLNKVWIKLWPNGMAQVCHSLLPRMEDNIPKWSQMLALRNPKKNFGEHLEISLFRTYSE